MWVVDIIHVEGEFGTPFYPYRFYFTVVYFVKFKTKIMTVIPAFAPSNSHYL
jgi:hypothetical protein